MTRKMFSVRLSLLIAGLFVGIFANVYADSLPVYSLATDMEIQGKALGSSFEGTTWFLRSGGSAINISDNAGVKSIKISARNNDWDCIDLRNLDTLPMGSDYTITVSGRAVAGAKMKLSQPNSPWGSHVSQLAGADGVYSLEKSFTFTQLQTEKAIRIQSEASLGNFTLEKITIVKTASANLAATTVAKPESSDKGISSDEINISFSSADKAKYANNFSVPFTANVAIEWVSNFGSGDSFSLKANHLASSTDYTGANNAVRLTFDQALNKNAVYTISYNVFVPLEGNKGKSTLTGPGVVLNGDYAGATGVVKFPSTPGTIEPGSWKTVSVVTPAGGLNDTLKSIDFRYVVNEGPKHPDLWYIDNISIKQQNLAVTNVQLPDYSKYPALKDVYKDYFMIGTTSAGLRMTGDKLDIIKYHFNAFTPENEMKPSSVQNTKGVFTYNNLDQQLAKIPGINLIGHTLAWHSQSPTWMWGTPNALSVQEARANLDAHITNVLNRYGASMYSIDVVNEAFVDGQNNADWKKNLRNNEGWYLALGPEWVEYAFLKAAEIVDAKGWKCKLYYNDYNLDYADKAKSVYEMVKDINERYAKKRPGGKPLIEGIGMQAHYNENTAVARVDNSIKLFSSLPNVAISITEMDITYSNLGALTNEQARSQAIKYAQLMELYKKNAAGSANKNKGRIERVSFWGTNDADSWRGGSLPLLFDKNLVAKEAFKAILDTDKYLYSSVPAAGKTYEAYPALKDVYKDYFTLGIFGSGEINALIHNFASFSPGNEMKPESTQRDKGTFTYTAMDNKIKDLSSRNPNILYYGHTLAWHSQSPTWMWDAKPARFGQPGSLDKAVALANLTNHIENVLTYYGPRLQGIDVVNEAIGISNPKDWKASLAKGEGWYQALGASWVELAFVAAAKVVDKNPSWKCKLIYNDFGLDSPDKARVVYEMVKDINARYAGTRPGGKQLIEVIGMQEHDNLTTKISEVENAIKLFASLPGVMINITEMDIGCPPGGTLTAENERNQAIGYAEMFRIFKKYAAGPANKSGNSKVIDRVSICGVRDAITGWRAGEFALLFNSEGLAKQALVAVLNPEDYLLTNKYIENEKSAELKAVNGVLIADAGRGDSWSGANIILGNDATKWPWSTAAEDGKTAFTPEKNEKYRLSINYTAKGTTAIRVRWIKDNTNGGYTKADGAAVNSYQYGADNIASTIPAYFNRGMVNGGSYTLITEIKLDGSELADGLIGNIAIRGGSGGNAYTINWIKVEKIGSAGASDKLLVDWSLAK